MWSSLALFANQGRFDFGTFNFGSFFEKLILIAFIKAAGQIDAFFVEIKFANELDSRYR